MTRWHTFQTANRLRLVNHALQVFLILSLIAGMNYLAIRHFSRFDLTENHRFALSPETRAYLQEIQQPVEIIVTIPRNSPRQDEQALYRYTSQLLKEFTYHSRQAGRFLVNVEYVDIYTDLGRAESLSRQYGLDQVNSVLVVSSSRRRLIRADELVTFSQMRPVAFKGEATLASAIIEVTQEQSPKLYFLKGHREMDPNDTSPTMGLSQLTSELRLRNFQIETLDLSTVPQVPEDASVLIIADPKGPLLTSELDKIRSYLVDRAGRVIAWVSPGSDTRLSALVAEWGMRLPDLLVIEPDPSFREARGTLLVRNFGEHPISRSLIDNQTFVLSGWARPVLPVAPQPVDERLSFIPVFASSASSWAESAFRVGGTPSFDAGSDIKGPVPLAVAAERRASSQLGIKVPGGRLVVFGTPDIFSNQHIASLGNVSLFLHTLNWMLDRDKMLVIPPRPVDSYQAAISQVELRKIALLFLCVPAAIALLGFIVNWIRKS